MILFNIKKDARLQEIIKSNNYNFKQKTFKKKVTIYLNLLYNKIDIKSLTIQYVVNCINIEKRKVGAPI